MVLPEGGEYVVSMNFCGKSGRVVAATLDSSPAQISARPERKATCKSIVRVRLI
jgi:hypothetical protein